MPTTPIYAFRYPAPSDPANVPADMQNLATDVETAIRRGAEVSYGTTLPASPVDGQEAVLVDSTTNPTYQWRFRYNAGSSSAYKWEYVGGIPQGVSGVLGSVTTSSTTFVDLTAGPTVTAPRAGEYMVEFGVFASSTVAGSGYGAYVQCLWSTAGAGRGWEVVNPTAQFGGGGAAAREKRTVVAAETAKLQVRVNAANSVGFDQGWLNITPIRVS